MSSSSEAVCSHLRNKNCELMHILALIYESRCLHEPIPIPKSRHFRELLWYLPDQEFKQETRMCHQTFMQIFDMIKDHAVFQNESSFPQQPVEFQMAVCFARLGSFGNGMAVGKVARLHGYSYGSVCLFTSRYVLSQPHLLIPYKPILFIS